MCKDDIILAALAAGETVTYEPVQVQKLLFLIDRRVAAQCGGPFFTFEPYDYGPFDPSLYAHLEQLSHEGLVDIVRQPGLRWNKYRLTPAGLKRGKQALCTLDKTVAVFIERLNDFVRSLSFAELVGAIYRAYPEMRVNSVFKD